VKAWNKSGVSAFLSLKSGVSILLANSNSAMNRKLEAYATYTARRNQQVGNHRKLEAYATDANPKNKT
jgi:hypothetical protein